MKYNIKELWIYPIKSCRGIQLEEVEVQAKGFAWDRELMLIDAQGMFQTQRKFADLATLQVALDGDVMMLSSSKSSIAPFSFTPTLIGEEKEVAIWKDTSTAIDQGDEVAVWFNEALGLTKDKQLRLVRQSPKYIRAIDPDFAAPNAPVSFADGYPCLITNTASLNLLNEKIYATHQTTQHAVTMNRFRPNIIIETKEAFCEGNWKQIKIGAVQFDNIKPCSRCVVTTADQHTGTRDTQNEPLRTLSTFRKSDKGKIQFGENLIPKNNGWIKIDDGLEVGL